MIYDTSSLVRMAILRVLRVDDYCKYYIKMFYQKVKSMLSCICKTCIHLEKYPHCPADFEDVRYSEDLDKDRIITSCKHYEKDPNRG